jgi:hypothetical protein
MVSSEDAYSGLLGYDIMLQPGRWSQMFQSSRLPPLLGLKIEAV